MVDISFPITGSVTEFIDWALIVVFILIIHYILRLIFFSSGDSSSSSDSSGFWGWIKSLWDRTSSGGSGGSGRPGGGGGRVDVVPDYRTALNEIEQRLNDYDASFSTFQMRGNDVLNAHHLFVVSLSSSTPAPVPDASALQWRSYHDTLTALNGFAGQINILLDRLVRDVNFARINNRDEARFNVLTTRWTGYVTRTQTYINDFAAKYGRGDPA